VSQRLSLQTPFWQNFNSNADLMPPVPLTTMSGRYRNRSQLAIRRVPSELSTPASASSRNFACSVTRKSSILRPSSLLGTPALREHQSTAPESKKRRKKTEVKQSSMYNSLQIGMKKMILQRLREYDAQ